MFYLFLLCILVTYSLLVVFWLIPGARFRKQVYQTRAQNPNLPDQA